MEICETIRNIHSKTGTAFYYMKVSFKSERKLNLDVIQLKTMLIHGIKGLHGEVGASLLVDILQYLPDESKIILRVENKGLQQLWNSLSWFHTFNGTRILFRVEKVSSCLLSLAVDSRNYEHS